MRKRAVCVGVQELAKEFGWYPSDWKELAVPRRGGVIVEGFNSDEVSASPMRTPHAPDRTGSGQA